MFHIFDRIYEICPFWMQNVGISVYGLVWRQRRFGGHFQRYVREFKEREKCSPEEWERYQETALRDLLLSAAATVPYYQENFRDARLTRDDLGHFGLEDLPRLPLLEKESIRQEPEQFLAANRCERVNTYLTSGTTGTPLAIKFTLEMDRLAQAAVTVHPLMPPWGRAKVPEALCGGGEQPR